MVDQDFGLKGILINSAESGSFLTRFNPENPVNQSLIGPVWSL
jgi:hypothetical protein